MSLPKLFEKLLFNCFSFSNVKDDWLKIEIERFKLISLDIIKSIPCRENKALDVINWGGLVSSCEKSSFNASWFLIWYQLWKLPFLNQSTIVLEVEKNSFKNLIFKFKEVMSVCTFYHFYQKGVMIAFCYHRETCPLE